MSLFLVVLIVFLPLGIVVSKAVRVDVDVWEHVYQYVLPSSVLNTVSYVLLSSLFATVLGVAAAWLISFYDFKGRKFFEWALFLPLALPSYIYAFVVLSFFEASGPLQSFLRNFFSLEIFVNPKNILSASLTMGASLMPYVYLASRLAFLNNGSRLLEASRSLGLKPLQAFLKVILPQSKPWILGGTLLVAMESLSDFGVSSLFNLNTFSVALYKTWYSLFSLSASSRFAVFILFTALILLALHYRLMPKIKQLQQHSPSSLAHRRIPLVGPLAWAAACFPVLLLFGTFIGPLAQLLIWNFSNSWALLDLKNVYSLLQSLGLAFVGAVVICALALLCNLKGRHSLSKAYRFFSKLSGLGYAIPGTVLAVGYNASIQTVIFSTGLWGALFMMIVAYTSRFFAVAYEPIFSHLRQIPKNLELAANSLGVKNLQLDRKLYYPLLKPAIVSALLFCAVDILKELPMTLMTRPFGLETLAIRVHNLASEGEWHQASAPALYLVAVSFLPVWFLIRQSSRKDEQCLS